MQRGKAGKAGKHGCRRGAPAPPVPPAEGDLGDLLAGAQAVERGAAGESARPQPVVDGAAEVGAQVRAWLAGCLVDREVRGGRERGRDAAQREAALAIRPQLKAAPAGG